MSLFLHIAIVSDVKYLSTDWLNGNGSDSLADWHVHQSDCGLTFCVKNDIRCICATSHHQPPVVLHHKFSGNFENSGRTFVGICIGCIWRPTDISVLPIKILVQHEIAVVLHVQQIWGDGLKWLVSPADWLTEMTGFTYWLVDWNDWFNWNDWLTDGLTSWPHPLVNTIRSCDLTTRSPSHCRCAT